MTDDSIKAKALALVNEVRVERGWEPLPILYRTNYEAEALYRTLEQHEAFKQKVSDAIVSEYLYAEHAPERMQAFIIPKPKPDPLVEAYLGVFPDNQFTQKHVARIRAALDALGFEIREKEQ